MIDKSNPLKAVKTSPLPIKIDYEPTWWQRLKKTFYRMGDKNTEHQNKGGLTMNRSTLKQYHSIVEEINDLDAEINELDSRPDLFINLTLDLDTQLEKLRSIRKEIEERMWRLTSQERRVIRKKYFYGMSYKEIAAEMKCSVDHVKKTAWHAVKKMEEE